MLTNADITIYNQYTDMKTRMKKWNRTVLHGVSAYINTKASLINDSARRGNETTFRIPASCDKYNMYLREEEYFGAEHKENFWTLATGDLVVHGICPVDDISGISTLEKNHFKVFRMCSISDNRRGIEPHLRVRCE